LNAIQSGHVENAVVVVVRYFGGILLGAGGLVRAYSHSAKIAAEGANIIRMSPCSVLKVSCDYGFYGKLSTLIPEFQGIIEDTQFAENVSVVFRLPATLEEGFRKELTESSFGKVFAEKTGEKFDSI
jgi:putative IMPACT (imprinted ancient) family translation regulator